jgi:hypothetical protein
MITARTILQDTSPTIACTDAPDGASLDPSTDRELHIEAVHHLLASTWPATVEAPDPDVLHAVARALIAGGTPIPAVPTAQVAGRLLAEALSDARAAHTRAVADHATADSAWHAFRADVRHRAAQAVDDGHICLEGTNRALSEFDIEALRREYRVTMCVTVCVTVSASNKDSAYDTADYEIRNARYGTDADVDVYDVDYLSAEANDDLDN